MPHVIVKMHSGRTEAQKKKLAEEVTKAVMASTGNGDLGQHRGHRAVGLDRQSL
jgi:hypothetical protein